MLKLYKRPAAWVLLLVSLVLSQVFNYLVPYAGYLSAHNDRAAERILTRTLPENLIPNSIGGFPVFAGALALTLGAVSVGSEYGWGTLKTMLIQRPRRPSVYAGQPLVLAVAVFAIVLCIFAFGALTSYAIAASHSEPVAWEGQATLTRGFASGWLILMMWCLLGAMLAFLFRGMALPIGLGVVWVLGVENLVVNVAARLLDFAETLQKGLPGVNAGSLVGALGGRSDAPGVNSLVDGTQATLVLVAYAVVFVLIGAFALRRRDVT
ncbi:MAG TPA: ABC transporter permease subunit [Candidatus Sulfotelmatobacter sp.]|nr:ABC transporter permease subunit [Candidatus Sulfotelmatobacter sp.]